MACIVAVFAASASPAAQTEGQVIRRVGDWVHQFVNEFANVVAEEDYVPTSRSLGSRLRSDYLLVRYPGSIGNWQTFRDVVAVNGGSLKNQPERLAKLFLQPFEDVIEQANAITRHSARYLSPLSDPLLAIAVLQRQYQPRFTYTLGDMDRGVGLGVRRIRFEERITPTILRTGSGGDLPTRGTAWVIEASGRIVRTELQIGDVGLRQRAVAVSTAFKQDEALGIYVPATMQDAYLTSSGSSVRGPAYYTRFRRFAVHTAETIAGPQP
jgi:hypothetical protein